MSTQTADSSLVILKVAYFSQPYHFNLITYILRITLIHGW